MKIILTIYFGIQFIGISYAQFISPDLTSGGNDSQNAVGNLMYIQDGNFWTNPLKYKEKIVGSPYLFSEWNKTSKFYLNNKIYTVPSVNYNLKNERFEAKLAEDSVLVFDMANVKKVEIGDQTFIPFYDELSQKITYYEEIWKSDDYLLLRKFVLKIKDEIINSLTKTIIKPKEYTSEEIYYFKQSSDSQLRPFRLRKKEVLGLIESEKQSIIKEFQKENNLNYKEINDVRKILNFYIETAP